MNQSALVGLATILWVVDAIAIVLAIILAGIGFLYYLWEKRRNIR